HAVGNKLSSIPQGFFRATPDISSVSISGNRIHTLTKESFSGLKSLYFFSLARNQITELPADIFSDLQINHVLDLSNNQITEIPDGLWKTTGAEHNIQYLLLQRNNLTQLKNTTFEGLKTLHQIFLNNNFIRNVDRNTFNNTGVQFIFLFQNRLTNLKNDSFGGGTVKSIHIYNNDIEEISETALGGIGNATMYLNCANLKKLPRLTRIGNGVCIYNEFVPKVTFSQDMGVLTPLFQKLGFQCLRNPTNVTCSPCKPGGYGNGIGECMTCPRDEIGSEKCKNCSSGNYVLQGNGSSASDCKACPEGTDRTRHAGFRACFCKQNYTRTNRFGRFIWQNTKARETDGRLFVDKLSSRMKIFLGFYQVVGDLYESIHIEKFWFWEILELCRKVGQTMFITLLGWEDALTKLFTIGTSVLFLALHVKFSPMESRFEQHLQLFSLTAIFLNILVAAVHLPVQYQATLSTLLILLDIGVVLAVAGEVVLVLVRIIRRKLWPGN
ncbi:hypothetical protein BSL78_23614, partial [Apostichopus japonicus]